MFVKKGVFYCTHNDGFDCVYNLFGKCTFKKSEKDDVLVSAPLCKVPQTWMSAKADDINSILIKNLYMVRKKQQELETQNENILKILRELHKQNGK